MIDILKVEKLQNHRTSVLLKCPKCGNPGRLRIISPKSDVGKVRFKVIHGYEYRYKCCTFGFSSEWYEDLERIYFEKMSGGDEDG